MRAVLAALLLAAGSDSAAQIGNCAAPCGPAGACDFTAGAAIEIVDSPAAVIQP